MHAIIQSDERVRSVVDQIDEALQELDTMDNWLLLYSAELNVSLMRLVMYGLLISLSTEHGR